MAVTDDGGDAGKAGQFLRSALGVAAGGDNAGSGIEAVGAANIGAGLAVGFGGDAAGVDDHHIGVLRLAFWGARSSKEGRDRFAVSAGRAAAKVFDVVGRRHRVSLAELAW